EAGGDRTRAGVRAGGRARRRHGDQRAAGPPRPLGRQRAHGPRARSEDGHRHRRPPDRGAALHELRRVHGAPRRAHQGRRAQHAAVRALPERDPQGPAMTPALVPGRVSTPATRLVVLTIYAAAMGWLEAVVVIYLSGLVGFTH